MLGRFADRRLWFFSTKAKQIYTDAKYQPDDMLVFGKETRGLPESLLTERSDFALRIPIAAEARSLNLATAVAICSYEFIRQVGTNSSTPS
jgi:tRNA (cytidine/uridine-2'-O-)-methyltransferase